MVGRLQIDTHQPHQHSLLVLYPVPRNSNRLEMSHRRQILMLARRRITQHALHRPLAQPSPHHRRPRRRKQDLHQGARLRDRHELEHHRLGLPDKTHLVVRLRQ